MASYHLMATVVAVCLSGAFALSGLGGYCHDDPRRHVKDPYVCNRFYRCFANRKVYLTCPEGLHFNPNKEVCDWPFNVDCIPQTDTVLLCENHRRTIRCPLGTTISVRYANYGRKPGATSICAGRNVNGLCPDHSVKTMSKVEAGCAGKRSCLLIASNGVFADPCVGIYKYLELRYSCILS